MDLGSPSVGAATRMHSGSQGEMNEKISGYYCGNYTTVHICIIIQSTALESTWGSVNKCHMERACNGASKGGEKEGEVARVYSL